MAQQDYYELLGVERNADAAALKKAYRQKAMQYHPDRNPGDSAAEAKFKELSIAYDILRDPEKRAAYDRHGHAAFDGTTSSFDFNSVFDVLLTQLDKLMQIGRQGQLWHDPDREAFTTIRVGGHQENHRIRSKMYKSWLLEKYYRRYEEIPGTQAMADALRTIEALAQFDGEEHKLFVRLGSQADRVYLDLGDAAWRCIEVTADGWRIIGDPPVKFWRPKGMRPLPEPQPGGSIAKLLKFINIDDDADWRLLIGCILGMFSAGPFPILVLGGEQGSGKSTICRVIRRLVDPNISPVRTIPRSERDLMIAARNSHVIAFNNLSSLPPWLSDALCTLSDGGGFSTRQLRTDSEEQLFDAMRPVIINGISDLATRPDLVDRAVCLALPPVNDDARLPEAEFWAAFDVAQPSILGALLDGVVIALARQDEVRARAKRDGWRLPRMSDFALWIEAAAPAFGWGRQQFLNDYVANRREAVEIALDASVLTPLIRDLADHGGFDGLITKLLTTLREKAPESTVRNLPSQGNLLSGELRRLAPAFRQTGIQIDIRRTNRGARIRIRREEPAKLLIAS